MSRPLSFQKDPEARSALLTWHAGLEHDRGARARLRRAPTPDEVAFEPAFHRLLRALLPEGEPSLDEQRAVAAVAGLAARVKQPVEGPSLAAQMGSEGINEFRFRRLLTADDPVERYTQLARIVQQLGRRVNLLSLADAAYRWSPELRQRWAFDYYQTAPLKEISRR